MSYLVLARKHRPKTFAEMVGQEHVVQALVNALQSQRLHHAYLFTGTRGIGKTTVSRILAKSLNCIGTDGTGGITAEPCGQCAACKAIDDGSFIDYTELDAASNRGVDEVQALLEQALYKPVQGRFKVFMIDEVHMLSNTAFNAMLKTLEEPPEYLKFVLATTDPQKVPVTVLSRCLQFNLRPMAPETIMGHLQQVFEREQIQAEPQALALLARAAQGSMRDALSLCDQAVAYGAGSVQERNVRSMLGCADSSYTFRLIEALQQQNAAEVVEIVHELRQQGVSSTQVLEDMALVLQRMTVQQWLPDKSQKSDPSDVDAQKIISLAGGLPADITQLLYSMCIHGRNEIGIAPDEYAGLTMILLRFFAFHPAVEKKNLTPVEIDKNQAVVSVNSIGTKTEQPIQGMANIDIQPTNKDETVANESTLATTVNAFAPTKLGDKWNAIAIAIKDDPKIVGLARTLLMQSQLLSQQETQWVLQVEHEVTNNDTSRKRLEQSIETYCGQAIKLQVVCGEVHDTPMLRQKDAQLKELQQAQNTLMQHPFIQSVVQEFDAYLVSDSLCVGIAEDTAVMP